MSEQSVDDLVAGVRAHLQAELETRLAGITAAHRRTVDEVRRASEAAADTRWSALLHEARADAQAQAEHAVSAARVETRRALSSAPTSPQRLAAFIAGLDGMTSLTETLSEILRGARACTADAALFLTSGTDLEAWGGGQVPRADVPQESSLAIAVGDARRTRTSSALEQAIAVPLLVDGEPVAILAATRPAATEGVPSEEESWAEGLEVIARVGAARLASLTATRTLQARGWLWLDGTTSADTAEPDTVFERPTDQIDGDLAARRYARLLLSEMRMYNEASVQSGRDARDLQRRLAPEIERARQLYEQRVPATLPGRAQHFQEELVRTLADGDPSLLG